MKYLARSTISFRRCRDPTAVSVASAGE